MSKASEALNWAETKIGANYSQANRWGENTFDCSSLVYRAYAAAGVPLKHKDTGVAVSTSTSEVYAADFELLYPSGYALIGKSLPTTTGLLPSLDLKQGDLIFYNYGTTTRPNKITHVSMYAGNKQIIHARNPKLGVRFDSYSYMNTSVCAVIRYKEDSGQWEQEGGEWHYVKDGTAYTGWQQLDWSGGNDWFLFDSSGQMLKGWQNVNGRWYYLDPNTGAMKTGWLSIDGADYYLKENGAMASGAAVLSSGGASVWVLGEDGNMQEKSLPIVK